MKERKRDRGPMVAVIGGGAADEETYRSAVQVGRGLARGGATVICGGLGGVMAAVCEGVREAGGLAVGVLPGTDAGAANPFVDVAIPTGMGDARNVIVVRSGCVVVAVGGSHGTLSEMAFALKFGIPVVSLGSWEVDPAVEVASGPQDAVARALGHCGR